ncbi:MAG TPA: restriction endonuclease subunit S [Thermoanaerobaculia bacterium]|nr:restriction endonuclease subunit S [Thermoanaerobaculia bacterium]
MRKVHLGDVVDFISGGTPNTSTPHYWSGSIPWASAKDLKSFYLWDTADHVSEDGAAAGTRFVNPGTTLLLTRGMTLLKDVPVVVAKTRMTFNQDIKALIAKPALDPTFLPYILVGRKLDLLSMVDLAGHGTGRLNSEELRRFEIVLPSRPQQRRIAEILCALDDKIELNRRMNETLEAIARAVFLKHFASETSRAELRDVVTALRRGVSPTYVPAGGVRVVNQKCVRDGWLSFDACRRHDDTHGRAVDGLLLRVGDIVVNSTGVGTLGRVAQVHDLTERTTFDSHVTVVRPDVDVVDELYVGFVLRMSQDDIEELGEGSTGQTELSGARLGSFEIPYAPLEKQRVFAQIAKPLVQRQLSNEHESATLAQIRDTLLPKLLSGELRVRDAEDVVADATAGAAV